MATAAHREAEKSAALRDTPEARHRRDCSLRASHRAHRDGDHQGTDASVGILPELTEPAQRTDEPVLRLPCQDSQGAWQQHEGEGGGACRGKAGTMEGLAAESIHHETDGRCGRPADLRDRGRLIFFDPLSDSQMKAKGGMGKSQAEEKKAVECGYWHLWRYNPALAEEGKNPFSLDSKEPNWENFHDFLLGEVRYLSVKKAYPNEAEELFAEAQKMAQLRYKTYIRKTQENWED